VKASFTKRNSISNNSVEWSSEISLTDTFPRTKQAKYFELMVDTGTEIIALYLESMLSMSLFLDG